MRYVVAVVLIIGVVLVGRTAAGRIGFGMGYSPPPGVVSLTVAPDGGWTQIPDPKAYHYNGYTYFGWIDGTSGATEMTYFKHSDRTVGTPIQLADLNSPDNHDSPALMVRESDHRLLAVYGRSSNTQIRLRISVNSLDTDPTLSGGFATEVALDSQLGGTEYTYASLVQLRGVTDDPIYLIYRDTVSSTGRIAYSVSTDGGATWAAQTVLFNPVSGQRAYRRIGTDWDTRIDFFTTERDPTDSSLYHFYLDGSDDTLHESDGTTISTTLPITSSDATLVLDNSNGAAWSFGASWDGAPATVIMQENTTADNRILVARWRSGAWQVDTVVESVGGQLGINQYASGAAIHHTDPDTVYLARKISGKFEMYRYTSPNDGATWSAHALTSGSADDNVWVEVPHFAASGMRAMWLRGSYTSDTNFSFGISAAR